MTRTILTNGLASCRDYAWMDCVALHVKTNSSPSWARHKRVEKRGQHNGKSIYQWIVFEPAFVRSWVGALFHDTLK